MRTLSRRSSFVVVMLALFVMMIAAGAPSPLYGVWARSIDFSASTLTVIFAIYVVALLAALLVVGSLSDYIGRKPVLLAALVLEAVSLALFLPANSVGGLILARIVQGVATGTAFGALGAALIDTQPPGTRWGTTINSVIPALGLGLGALGAGGLIQYAPDPTHLVFWILIPVVLLVAVGTLFLPETATPQPGALASLRPEVRVDRAARTAFVAGLPVFVACWAVIGLYLSLGGSIATGIFAYTNHLISGVVIAALAVSAAIGCLLLRSAPAPQAVRTGSVALIIGLVITLVGVSVGTHGTGFAVFLVGSVITGFGFGVGFMGSFGAVMVRVGATDRAATLAAVLTASYVAFSIPAVIAGFVSTHIGLRETTEIYGYAVIAIALLAMVLEWNQARSRVGQALPAGSDDVAADALA